MKKFIKEKIIKQIELDELDFEVEKELLDVNPNDHNYVIQFFYDHNTAFWYEGEHLSIDQLIQTAKNLKEKGSTHIQIYPHTDHHGYIFTGVKLNLIPEEEAIEEEKERLKEEIKIKEHQHQENINYIEKQEEEINHLHNRLEELKNSNNG